MELAVDSCVTADDRPKKKTSCLREEMAAGGIQLMSSIILTCQPEEIFEFV